MKASKVLICMMFLSLVLAACAVASPFQTLETNSGCKRITFVMSSPDGSPGVFTACPGGTGLRQLARDAISPAWSPDGTRIAFVSSSAGNNALFVMQADGSKQTRITTDANGHSLPRWLADGQTIAFRSSDRAGLWWWSEIRQDGSGLKKISQPSYDFFFQTPAWSPDGNQVAYMSMAEQKQRNDGSSQIHVRGVDGEADRALTSNIWMNFAPAWSPDGGRIAFLSELDGTYYKYSLYLINSDGSGLRRLLDNNSSIGQDSRISWSPDGRFVAIDTDTPPGGIQIVDVATGEKQPFLPLAGNQRLSSPAWQP